MFFINLERVLALKLSFVSTYNYLDILVLIGLARFYCGEKHLNNLSLKYMKPFINTAYLLSFLYGFIAVPIRELTGPNIYHNLPILKSQTSGLPSHLILKSPLPVVNKVTANTYDKIDLLFEILRFLSNDEVTSYLNEKPYSCELGV